MRNLAYVTSAILGGLILGAGPVLVMYYWETNR